MHRRRSGRCRSRRRCTSNPSSCLPVPWYRVEHEGRWRRRSSCRSYPGSRRRPRATRGAAARPASRASRSRISRKRLSIVTGDSFFDQLLMPPPRPLLRARRHEHLEPGVRETPRCPCRGRRRRARAAAGRPAAGRGAPRARPGWTATREAAALTASLADRLGDVAAVEHDPVRRRSATSRPARSRGERALRRRRATSGFAAPSARPADRASRCREGGSRAPARPPPRSCPCPTRPGRRRR